MVDPWMLDPTLQINATVKHGPCVFNIFFKEVPTCSKNIFSYICHMKKILFSA